MLTLLDRQGLVHQRKNTIELFRKAKEIRRDLKRQGFPNHPIVDSGNGAQLVIKTDLANNEQNVRLIKHSSMRWPSNSMMIM